MAENEVLLQAMEKAKGARLHLIGLLSDGGVHSHNTHLYALLQMAAKMGLEKVYVHAVLDGRDVPPRSALGYLQELETKLQQIGTGKVATVSGRYYTMDRDKRWERVEKAYRCLTQGEGQRAATAREAVENGYLRGENDEFLLPTVLDEKGRIRDGDSIIFFNFRPDRAREITRAFVDKDFQGFSLKRMRVFYTCMTQYDEALDVPVAFKPQTLEDTFGEYISGLGYKQLRIAETEKYAHVTFFFDGGVEKIKSGEERILVQSPSVATYDMQPYMSAPEVTDKVIAAINEQKYDFIVMNYANCDMVGHTGVFEAAVEAVKTVDACVAKVIEAVRRNGGVAFITADHGNADEMWDYGNNCPHTAHTLNMVPFIVVDDALIGSNLREGGVLADIMPTMLKLAGIEQPESMSGQSLL